MGDSDIQRRHLCYDARSLSSDSPIVINKRRLKHLWTPASNEIDTTPKTTTNEQRKKERKKDIHGRKKQLSKDVHYKSSSWVLPEGCSVTYKYSHLLILLWDFVG